MLSLYKSNKFLNEFVLKYLWVKIIFFTLIGFLRSEENEGIILHSIHTKSLLPQIIKPFENIPKTLALKTSDSLWNNHFFDIVVPRKDHRKFNLFINVYKDFNESILIENSFGIYQTFDDVQLRIPSIVKISWYKKSNLYHNEREQIYKKFTEKFTKKKRNKKGSSSRALRVNIADIGDQEVALNIRGNIDITGQVIFQDQELVNTNSREDQSWDLEIDQKQSFNIEGTVGERISVLVDQNSEADFSWENDILIKYEGKDDEILKSVDAGNISLSLPSTQFVTYGSGKSEGLFGIKAVKQLGPLSMTTILSREQVKKSSKSKSGDETSSDIEIKDYNFVKDRYFFIDENFKYDFYPLSDGLHTYPANEDGFIREVTNFNLYKQIQNPGSETAYVEGVAYLNPNPGFQETPITGYWIKLAKDVDYTLYEKGGYFRLSSSVGSSALAVAYNIDNILEEEQTYTDYDYIATGDELLDTGLDGVFDNYENGCGSKIDTVLTNLSYSSILQELINLEQIESIDSLNQVIYTTEDGNDILICGSIYWTNTNCEKCSEFDPNGDNYLDENNNGLYDIGEGTQNNNLQDSDDSYTEFCESNDDNLECEPDSPIQLKLIKREGISDPSKDTWSLMFKNVYDLGARQINMDDFELEIVHSKGLTGTETFSPQGKSFLHIFGLDSLSNSSSQRQEIEGGDGIIDNVSSIINPFYGEIILPFYRPFSYQSECYNIDNSNNLNCVNWGNQHPDLVDIYDDEGFINDSDNDGFPDEGPAMYFSTSNNSQELESEHQFYFKVKYSERSSTMTLGFMVVEGSEEVIVNGQNLIRNQDYIIDYFSGSITFTDSELGRMAVDPASSVNVTYEENQLVSFDQKLMAGTRMEMDLGENNFIGFTALYYNQTIMDDKVDIGYEPLRNFIWDINGKYSNEINLLTKAVDALPLIETTSPSKFSIEGEYAQVTPNPNPLGQAFLDDFESSKIILSPSVMDKHWKLSSPPINSFDNQLLNNDNRSKMYWYNPYQDVNTTDIWPNKETSSRAGNNTTKTLILDFNGESDSDWNGITTNFYQGSTNQSDKKFLEIWFNSSQMEDNDAILHIDIGYISEDINLNGSLDTEDKPDNSGIGNFILDDGEDTGLDGCADFFEDGEGGCVDQTSQSPYNIDTNPDPNQDNWSYNPNITPIDYSQKNGTEGNSLMEGYTYPDTEDLNNNFTLDNINSYFTTSFKPTEVGIPTNDGFEDTDWKLYRIFLSDFEKITTNNSALEVEWSDVKSLRLWMNNINSNSTNKIQIAKIELVGNKWIELGKSNNGFCVDDSSILDEESCIESNYIWNDDEWIEDEDFGASVANTEDDGWYSSPSDVIVEEDKVYNIKSKEQALVLDFNNSGISPLSTLAIKRSFESLSNDKKNSFFIYDKLKMHVHGIPNFNDNVWTQNDTTVQLIFQFGLDNNNYYEVVKPVSIENTNLWANQNNFIDINLGQISKKKETIFNLETYQDIGIDSTLNEYENGCGGSTGNLFTYEDIINDLIDSEQIDTSIGFNELYFPVEDNEILVCGQIYWNQNCMECNLNDPNGDNYVDQNLNGQWDTDEGTEGNFQYDYGELFEDFNNNLIYDDPNDYKGYDIENDVWFWESGSGTTYEKINIKGDPSIDRINQIIIGVHNIDSISSVYGSVLINEMRFTDVKRTKGQAFRIKTDINFADLLSFNSSFERREAEFRTLQERLGSGTTTDKISFNSSFNPDKILPAQWGIKTPVSINYSTSISTPKYRTGTDILVGEVSDAPDSIKTMSESISMSTSFKKTTRSDKWWLKYTLDKFSTNLSASYRKSSDLSVASNISQSYSLNLAYSYQFSNENYWRPLKFIESAPLIGKTLSESKLFWSPKKIQSNMKFNEDTNTKLYRNGQENLTEGFDLIRDFSITYQFTNSLTSSYSKNIKSDLIEFKNSRDARIKAIEKLDPGLVTNMSEQLSNTLSMDKLRWLRPTFTYNSKFSWGLKVADNYSTIASDNTLKSSFNFNTKDFIETFYTPENSGSTSSSSRPGRNRNRNKSNKRNYNVQNKYIRFVINPFHKIATRLSPISASYSITINNSESGLLSDQMPNYFYRFGLYSMQNEIFGTNFSNLSGINNAQNITESWVNKISRDLSLTSGLNLLSGIVLKFNFINKQTTTTQQNNSITITKLKSVLPVGLRGDDILPGINKRNVPIPNWDLNWSGLHKLPFINKIFNNITLTHAYKGELSQTENETGVQSEEYLHQFKPLIGLNFKLKGQNPINISSTFSQTLSIKNDRGTSRTTERLLSNTITSDVSYSKQGGLYIPIFFFRDFNIDNDITFKLRMSYDNSIKTKVQPNDDSSQIDNTKNISIRPELTYSFTRWVNGGLHFDYKFIDNLTSGKRTERDFGFSIKIKIQG